MQKNVKLEGLKSNSVVVVAGPTASGKSALAIDLALKYNGVVINADASQVYKDIPIISAAPNDEDKLKVQHLLYGIFDASHNGTVSEWLDLVVGAIKDVWDKGKLPVLVGGTGFYIESLIKGVSPIPETSKDIKAEVAELFETKGLGVLYEYLCEIDPNGAKRVNPNDTTRVRRALEIFLSTGKSIDEWFEIPLVNHLPEAEFEIVALLPELSVLEQKCYDRFDIMMQAGALEEVNALVMKNLDENLPVMKAIGVSELISYLKGEISLKDASDLAKLHTRQYAKRQLTWFRNRLKSIAKYIVD